MMTFRKKYWRIFGWLGGLFLVYYLFFLAPYVGFKILLSLVVGAAVGALFVAGIWHLLFPSKNDTETQSE
jgi:hypothetical protein